MFEKYEKATTEEISTDIAKNLKNKRIIESFAKRIECHLEAVLSQSGEAPKLEEINDDFRYFLTNFNTLCKVDYLAETLLGNLNQLSHQGRYRSWMQLQKLTRALTQSLIQNS